VPTPFEQLRVRLAEICDLGAAGAILSWDQQVMMPAAGAAVRAEQLATVGAIAHERFTAPEVAELLEQLEGFEAEHDYDSFEASLVRVARLDLAKARKVPTELRAEMARASSRAIPVWVKAREDNDFASFLPALRENLELRKRYVACFEGEFDEPYDALLDNYERGMKTAELRTLFAYLREHQVPLIRAVAAAEPVPAPADRVFPLELQRRFEREIVGRFGFDETSWRLDPTVHPFATGAGIHDVRITTRYFEHSLDGLFATMHETGHGLYERQIDASLERSPLARGASLGLHESQSRMWENLVGRSLPCWRFFFPRAKELFPEALAGYDIERWYREINAVAPSLIRVESDEATYNLHVMLRFELEQEMLAGSFPLTELPEQWNRRVWDYLGIEVPDDRRGVLQDTHWAGGSIGYFPTYTLGNVISVQLWEHVVAEIPDLEQQFERGEFGALREWLRERVHRYGRMFTPRETLERAIGTSRIDPEPYVRYLRTKIGAIYGLPVAEP
jgi:carboxypeptidase Taq